MKHKLYQRLIVSVNSIVFCAGVVYVLLSLLSCSTNNNTESTSHVQEIQVTPAPFKILYKRDFFELKKSMRVLMNLSDSKSKQTSEVLITLLKKKTGHTFKIADRFTTSKLANTIEIITNEDKHINPQGFKIMVGNNKIKLYANDLMGLQYGTQTIVDLLQKEKGRWLIPQATIIDEPKIEHRAIYLTLPDSVWPDGFLKLLVKNRINQLITPQKYNLEATELVLLSDTANLNPRWKQAITSAKSIKQLYLEAPQKNTTAIFTINQPAMLSADSLGILGEALWSSPAKLNYLNIINRLALKNSK
ncbi:MAG: glycoside hydrolase family 20 zincin-like fold domain-containing protein [Cyclobacteriaceae bacterium]|nr:glycoside hydrolase family 20 zincin-like fold domain-containing protein [Cyclobacteriaceae bacterium]